MSGFEPFFNYDKLTQAMADELRLSLIRCRVARDSFMRNPATILGARAVLESALDTERTVESIQQAIWTLPMIVHVAGERQSEFSEDDDGDRTIQRCKRCGSTLHLWHEHLMVLTPRGPAELDEDDIPWWDEDTLVAKGSDAGRIAMYRVDPDKLLEKHELECVSLVDIRDD